MSTGTRRGSGRSTKQREDRGADREGTHRDPVDLVQIEPEEEHVAADQGTQQRADRVPCVQASGDGSQVADLAPQLVEEQWEQAPERPIGTASSSSSP